MRFLEHLQFQKLLDVLVEREYVCIGPQIDQGAVIYERLHSVESFPKGWTEEHAPGSYRLVRSEEDSYFGYIIGPQSWKKFLFPPSIAVMRTKLGAEGWEASTPTIEQPKFAFIGVRACELAAIAIQDRVFTGESFTDPIYQDRRDRLFIVVVQCTRSAPTCFCSSMQTGPVAQQGFDLALTEIEGGFLVQVGSELGAEVAESLPLRAAELAEIERAEQGWNAAASQQTRSIDTEDLPEKLLSRLNHPHWNDVASRCLSCANCTLVCPTCFCSSVDEVTDLVHDEIVRQRRWDSCFNFDFSHISGGPVRNEIRSRYRQWLTHKLGSWVEQFDVSGCVGCGRCITWCPVGIDLTAEVAALCKEEIE